MLLITSPQKKYFDFSKKLIFLGKWCLSFKNSEKFLNEKDKIEIINYHWQDLDKVEKDSEYIYECYSKILPILAYLLSWKRVLMD